MLDYELIAQNPKIFMGFSDISILINAIYAKTGILTFHGPNIAYGFDLSHIKRPGLGEYTRSYLLQTLFETMGEIVIKPRQKWKTLRAGRAEGYLAGGNLFAQFWIPHLCNLGKEKYGFGNNCTQPRRRLIFA
jgi:muramoyltetrapeptide carboxypeptidase